MARLDPGDEFFEDFVEAADEFIATPTLKDRTPQLKARFGHD